MLFLGDVSIAAICCKKAGFRRSAPVALQLVVAFKIIEKKFTAWKYDIIQ